MDKRHSVNSRNRHRRFGHECFEASPGGCVRFENNCLPAPPPSLRRPCPPPPAPTVYQMAGVEGTQSLKTFPELIHCDGSPISDSHDMTLAPLFDWMRSDRVVVCSSRCCCSFNLSCRTASGPYRTVPRLTPTGTPTAGTPTTVGCCPGHTGWWSSGAATATGREPAAGWGGVRARTGSEAMVGGGILPPATGSVVLVVEFDEALLFQTALGRKSQALLRGGIPSTPSELARTAKTHRSGLLSVAQHCENILNRPSSLMGNYHRRQSPPTIHTDEMVGGLCREACLLFCCSRTN